MNSGNDENRFKRLTEDLKNLKKIDAPVGFEEKLWDRIKSDSEIQKKSYWNSFATKLIPAAAVAATAVILFMIIDNNASEYQDPFLIEPKERTDIISVSAEDLNLMESEPEMPKEQVQEKSTVRFRKKEAPAPEVFSSESQISGRRDTFKDGDSVTPETADLSVETGEIVGNEGLISPSAGMKQELNFRQVQLSDEEQKEVIQLKNKILKENQSKTK